MSLKELNQVEIMEKLDRREIKQKKAAEILDLSVSQINQRLNLRQPIYAQTAAYGHFGREGVSWEKVE